LFAVDADALGRLVKRELLLAWIDVLAEERLQLARLDLRRQALDVVAERLVVANSHQPQQVKIVEPSFPGRVDQSERHDLIELRRPHLNQLGEFLERHRSSHPRSP
jgi:hypothetical protein